MHDLYELHSQLYHQFQSAPVWDTGATKAAQVRHFTNWVRNNPGNLNTIITAADALKAKKAMQPVRGPVSGTHYISWHDFTALPSYPDLSAAVTFEQSGVPFTADGYVSVHAIYNMAAWENWKSSSLSPIDRARAAAIGKLNLVALMQLNNGRRKNEPALFPVNLLA
jgi:hypothetical protein